MVYLVQAEETNLYKIGYTAGKTKNRIKSMQTGCPYPLSIVKEVKGSQEKEKWLHESFSDNRKQGEWFEFDEDILENVCEKMAEERVYRNEIKLEEWKDHYEQHIKKTDSVDGHISNLIELAILEIICGDNDTAIQRLLEYRTLVVGCTYTPSGIPPLTEKIWNTE